MIFKNLLKIVALAFWYLGSYRFSLIKIIFYELIYLVKGNKGNRFSFSTNDIMTDNIPCPYYFLHKNEKKIRNLDFKIFLDLGCGSGRVIDFFNKVLPNKNFIGIEYYEKQFLHRKENFKTNENIKLVQEDFIKFNFLQYNADCYFFNHPIKDDSIFIDVLKKKTDSGFAKRSILLIFVNCTSNIFQSLKNIQCINTYYINDRKVFSIYYVNSK